MFKMIKFIYSICLLSAVFCSFSQTKTIPYQELATSSGSLSGSGIFFGASMTTSSITVTFEGPSDRWIALGIGAAMPSTDALIYSNGTSSASHTLGWFDYYISSYNSSGVTLDVTQNWNIQSNNVSASQRTVVATRTLSTGDANDAAINFTSTVLNLVWAKGSSADYTIAYHGSSNRANGISLTWLSVPSASFVTSTNTLCTGASLTYSNLSTGGLTSYTWNFAGGSPATSTSTNPVITYTAPGTYSVSLTATNALGSSTYTQINYVTVTPTISPSLSINQISGLNPLCAGAAASYTALPVNGGSAPSYQWKVNGTNVGTNSSSYSSTSLSNNSSVTCVVISNAVCASPSTVSSSAITMTVNSSAAATVSVAITSSNNPLCSGSAVTFSANVTNGGTTPFYQWKINGSNAGTNSSIFTSNALGNADIVSCELSSNAACASSTFAVSSGITMSVSSVLIPSVSILIQSGNNPLCAGALISFTATPINGGLNPIFQWKINGVNAGSNSSGYSATNFSTGQLISCEMVSALSCSSPSFAISSAITLTVFPIPTTPVITPSGTLGLCPGANLMLVSSANTGNLWSNTANTASLTVSSPGNYFVSQTLNGCTSPLSAAVTVTAHPQPSASILPVGPLCADAGSFTLQASPVGGTFSGNGVSGNLFIPSLTIQGNNLIVYSYTDANTCTDTASTNIQVSDCVSITGVDTENSTLRVSPNPTKGPLNITCSDEKITAIILSDATGKIIFKRSYKNEMKIKVDISPETSGIYFMRVFFGNNAKQFIISKED